MQHDGTLFTKGELGQQYNIQISILQYNRIKSVIPNSWTWNLQNQLILPEAINSNEQNTMKINTKWKPIELIKNKNFYNMLMKKVEQSLLK